MFAINGTDAVWKVPFRPKFGVGGIFELEKRSNHKELVTKTLLYSECRVDDGRTFRWLSEGS